MPGLGGGVPSRVVPDAVASGTTWDGTPPPHQRTGPPTQQEAAQRNRRAINPLVALGVLDQIGGVWGRAPAAEGGTPPERRPQDTLPQASPTKMDPLINPTLLSRSDNQGVHQS